MHSLPLTVGIDPHKHVHHAAVIDQRGTEVATRPFDSSRQGQHQLIQWAMSHGSIEQWAVEGTGGLGRHLAVELTAQGADVREVPPNATATKRAHGHGKSDRTTPSPSPVMPNNDVFSRHSNRPVPRPPQTPCTNSLCWSTVHVVPW